MAPDFIVPLRQAPFSLDDEAVSWVESTVAGLPLRRKLAQLFNVMLVPMDPATIERLAREQPGGVTQFLLGGPERALAALGRVAAGAAIPLLVSSDLEGGAMNLDGCTRMPNQLGMAAMGSPSLYERAVDVMAAEALALGINWTFTPVVDINARFRSAIVGTRSFGSRLQTILEMARIHVMTMQRAGLAATAKHWPGEGFDDRDQHLVTTLNPLSMAEWEPIFGHLFKSLVDVGVLTVMSGHIALPALAGQHGIDGIEAFRPASASHLINQVLLRQRLGFNGLITSDATPMGGLSSWGPRSRVLPEVIDGGCDMVLFTPDLHADLDMLEHAVDDGRLREKRIDAALCRVLATKARLGLHRRVPGDVPSWADAAPRLRTHLHQAVGREVAKAVPTLVKDVQGCVPLNLDLHRRVVLVTSASPKSVGPFAPPTLELAGSLRNRGFDVRNYDADHPPHQGDTDLVIMALAQESLPTLAHVQMEWPDLLGPMESAMRRWWHEIPTVLVSFGHPYYLYDAPRMPCVINAYSATPEIQASVVRKLLGDEPFTGLSPVDVFCGLPDAVY